MTKQKDNYYHPVKWRVSFSHAVVNEQEICVFFVSQPAAVLCCRADRK